MSKLTEELKNEIDSMSLEDIIRKIRFTPIGDEFFIGESYSYFAQHRSKVMDKSSLEDYTAASKRVGWHEENKQ